MVGGVSVSRYEDDGVEVIEMARVIGPLGDSVMALLCAPVPPGPTTFSRTGYASPFASPVMTSGLSVDTGERAVHVLPSSVE